MAFDVVEYGSNWFAFFCSLADGHVHVMVISGSIIWSGNVALAQFSNIGDNSKIITKALE